jgi:hypothetical protein
MNELKGGCLCGQVRYTVGEVATTAVCHCPDCQKQTGTSFSVVLAVPRASFNTQGTLSLHTTTGESGGAVARHFCGHCGSPIYSAVDAAPGVLFVKAGTLDDTSALKPQVEFWCDTAQPWLEQRADLPRMPRNPPLG